MANIKTAENGDIEIWLDGRFVASYKNILLSPDGQRVVSNMLEAAREFGQAEAKRAVREALGIR